MRFITSITSSVRDDAVLQPVGHVLGGDAQRRAVFHQADIVDVGHLGAADALIDPAHHIAEDALGVVLELGLDLVGLPVGPVGKRDGEDIVQRGRAAGLQLRPGGRTRRPRDSGWRAASRRWARAPRRSWRRPSGGRSSAPAWRASGRASPTCPCRSAPCRQAAFEADIDVAILIGGDPGLCLHVALADHRAGFHGGVDLVAGAVEEAGVDEHHAVLRRRGCTP
jgi:hypothetical protein